jgi:hypothetical protein
MRPKPFIPTFFIMRTVILNCGRQALAIFFLENADRPYQFGRHSIPRQC